MLRVFSLEDEEEIKEVLKVLSLMDVYATPEYLKLFEDYLGWEATYFFYEDYENKVLVPFFKRRIKDTDYFDLVGPWYFGGPLVNVTSKKTFKSFLEEFHTWCSENNVVSEFQRFNPILKNHELYEDNVFYDREIVYIDLTKNFEEIKKGYTKTRRKDIRRIKKKNVLSIHHSKDYLRNFINIYYDSMNKKNADRFYYFNKKFFDKLLCMKETALFSIEYDNKIICSSLELGSHKILYDYLRASIDEYNVFHPNDVLLDNVIVWAKKAGYHYFVLGGGNSRREDDGQLRFKKTFSSITTPFFIYKKIHNKEKYLELCKAKGLEELKFEEASYFPEYIKCH